MMRRFQMAKLTNLQDSLRETPCFNIRSLTPSEFQGQAEVYSDSKKDSVFSQSKAQMNAIIHVLGSFSERRNFLADRLKGVR